MAKRKKMSAAAAEHIQQPLLLQQDVDQQDGEDAEPSDESADPSTGFQLLSPGKRNYRGKAPNDLNDLHRRDPIPLSPDATSSVVFNTIASKSNTITLEVGTVFAGLLGGCIVLIAMALVASAILLLHRRSTVAAAPGDTAAQVAVSDGKPKRPLSRLSSASKLESQNTIRISTGAGRRESSTAPPSSRLIKTTSMLGGSPVYMDRLTSSPKASETRNSMSGRESRDSLTGRQSRKPSMFPSPQREELEVHDDEESSEESDPGSDGENDRAAQKEKERMEDSARKRKSTMDPDAAREEAKDVVSAIRALKSDSSEVVKMLARKTPDELEQLSKALRGVCGSSLEEAINSQSSGDVRKILIGLITPPIEYDVMCLEEAMKGLGCDEDAMMEVRPRPQVPTPHPNPSPNQLLIGRTNADILAIKEAYQKRYRKDLERTIISEAHGHLKRLFKIILQAQHDESERIANVEKDADTLYSAGVGRIGTDELVFIQILTDRNEAHLRKLFAEYRLKYKDSMEEAIRKEFRGDLGKALISIVRCAENRPKYIAHLFEKAMKGVGHNHAKLIRLIVRHRHPDVMRSIKMEYLVEFDKMLADRIKEETSGLYQKCLLELVGT
ncbi:Annexin A13 [Phlyctochytrium bullatum]|nr:Annexin A13 [Phlyctochytrium bullatum]